VSLLSFETTKQQTNNNNNNQEEMMQEEEDGHEHDDHDEHHHQSRKKKVLIATEGSRGDIQPYVALGLEFQRSGSYDAAVCTHEFFRGFVEDQGNHEIKVR